MVNMRKNKSDVGKNCNAIIAEFKCLKKYTVLQEKQMKIFMYVINLFSSVSLRS